MSGERYLIQAIQTRLKTDATLIGICNGGVWFGSIPDMNDVAGWTYSGGTAVLTGSTVALPTWTEYRVSVGGELHNATGPRFNDVSVRVECASLESLLKAINGSEQIDGLLVGWTPTVTNWGNAWKVTKTGEERDGGRAPPPMSRPLWRAIGIYRFRYGE